MGQDLLSSTLRLTSISALYSLTYKTICCLRAVERSHQDLLGSMGSRVRTMRSISARSYSAEFCAASAALLYETVTFHFILLSAAIATPTTCELYEGQQSSSFTREYLNASSRCGKIDFASAHFVSIAARLLIVYDIAISGQGSCSGLHGMLCTSNRVDGTSLPV